MLPGICVWFLNFVSQIQTHFFFFERVAESRDWSDVERTLLLQRVLTDKAQDAYSALSAVESRVCLHQS